jgi:AcrR family transcriptional regulator
VSGQRPTRQRILEESMRLFAERGYKATTVAQIEAAVGLSPGSGSLFKHFPSKAAVLSEGLESVLAGREDLVQELRRAASGEGGGDLQERLEQVALAGLRRMQSDRYLNRLLFGGLQEFPELLDRYRDHEITANHKAVAAMLQALGSESGAEADWDALAAVLVGATAHYWLLSDLFGAHPSGVDEARYAAACAALVVHLLTAPKDGQRSGGAPGT